MKHIDNAATKVDTNVYGIYAQAFLHKAVHGTSRMTIDQLVKATEFPAAIVLEMAEANPEWYVVGQNENGIYVELKDPNIRPDAIWAEIEKKYGHQGCGQTNTETSNL